MKSSNTSVPNEHDPGGIYIHFPFCISRCNYCSFVSYPYGRASAGKYLETLILEIDHWAQLYGKDSANDPQVFDSIYIGGGTPSIAQSDEWQNILEHISKGFRIMPEAEITIEVNPGTFDAAKSEAWRHMGINRISLGAQSFVDAELVSMKRLHDSYDIFRAVGDLKRTGLNNLSIDLLIGFPDQTIKSVTESLDKVFSCDPDHISVYLLEIKDGASIGKCLSSGELEPLDEDLSADMYELICDMMVGHGFEQYEISNFCKKGRESIHNTKYWTDGLYIGMGAGAHGRLREVRYSNLCGISNYESEIVLGKFPWETEVKLDSHTRMVEALLMGLRLNRGIDLIGLGGKYSIDAQEFVKRRLAGTDMAGLFEFEKGIMRLTDRGRLLSNVVFEKLI